MKKIVLSCLAVAAIATCANAQFAIGPEAGLNISNYTGFASGDNLHTDNQLGGRIGLVMQNDINHYFYIERGLYYVMNGYRRDLPEGTASVRVNTAELPLNLQYKFRANSTGDRVFIGIGAFLAFNFSGSYAVQDASIDRSLSMGSDQHDDLKVVDFGFGAHAGYQVSNGVIIRAHVQRGIVNLKPYGDLNNAVYSMNFGLSVGYLFMPCSDDMHHHHGHGHRMEHWHNDDNMGR